MAHQWKGMRATRIHIAARRCGRVAARGARTAAGDANDRVLSQRVARRLCILCDRVPQWSEGGRLHRGPKRRSRMSAGRRPTQRGRVSMQYRNGASALVVISAIAISGTALGQAISPTNSLPNPYRSIENWAQLPQGRIWGSTSAIGIDPDGSSVWVADRCGEAALPTGMKPGVPFACDGSNLDPILKFDASGKLVKSFGAGLFVLPHGLHVDRDGNVWVTDGLGRNGKGHQVIKFSPDEVLLRLGKRECLVTVPMSSTRRLQL